MTHFLHPLSTKSFSVKSLTRHEISSGRGVVRARASGLLDFTHDACAVSLVGNRTHAQLLLLATSHIQTVPDVNNNIHPIFEFVPNLSVKEIVVAINTCERLSALRLDGNTLGVNAAKAIAKALEGHREFKRALWKDMFYGRIKSEIPDALNFLSGGLILAGAQLSELDLSDNALGPIGVKGIQVLLENPTCFQLQQLRLNNNGLGIGGGEMLAQALLKCHENSISSERPFALKTFICGRNRLENEGAKALAEFFKTVGSLEEISMPQNGIYSDGISALAAAFSQNPRLQTINLNDNTVTDIGGEFLAQAIVSLESLRVLNLGDCLLRCGGAKSLATALKKGHPELEELYLGYNEIRAETGLIILDSLKNKKKLLKVDLDGNCFGVDGAKKIEESFENYLPDVLGSLSEDEGADDDTGDNDDLNDDVNDDDKDIDEHIEIPKHQTLQSEKNINSKRKRYSNYTGKCS